MFHLFAPILRVFLFDPLKRLLGLFTDIILLSLVETVYWTMFKGFKWIDVRAY